MISLRKIVGVVMLCALQAACAAATDDELIADPYEGFNRSVHSVNKGLDQAILRPASQAYDFVTPTLFRFLFANAISHLELPNVFVNQVLQGEGEEALSTLGRFAVNTVYGAAGALDPATELGLPKESTDFGLTLASWGMPEGAYVELPLFGPSSERDAVGFLVDFVLSPTTYVSGGSEPIVQAALTAVRPVDILESRSRRGALIDDLLYRSEDSYVSVRTNYIQNRRRRVSGGETDIDDLPDLFGN
ncbi:MAG: VacJ family lipoprotein [Paracoccaceae bacterium]